jgi:hypothetical protein
VLERLRTPGLSPGVARKLGKQQAIWSVKSLNWSRADPKSVPDGRMLCETMALYSERFETERELQLCQSWQS